MSPIVDRASQLVESGLWPSHFRDSFLQLYQGYLKERGERGLPLEPVETHFADYIELIERHLHHPFLFSPIHKRVREPFDFWAFGLRHARLMLDEERSTVGGVDLVDQMTEQLKAGENVIIFSNHQTELDCHLVSLLIEKRAPLLVDRMIWVAGDRVTTDPVAVPVSLGLNLICIYSKKYIDHPPERRMEKLNHNRQTMKQTRDLLAEGGQCIVLFPSGGRDRPGSCGEVEVAPFDPSSIEMFRLIAEHSGVPTHFYPLALSTYRYLPPPNEVRKELGECRICRYVPIAISFEEEVNFDQLSPPEISDKREKRAAASEAIWKRVRDRYAQFKEFE